MRATKKMSFRIKRITRKGFLDLSDSPTSHSMLSDIQRELIGDVALNKFIQRCDTLLYTDSQKVKDNPLVNPRGIEIYMVMSQEQIVGFMFLNFYAWDILAPQICIRTEICNSQKMFSLRPFSELENKVDKPKFAAEIFILWVAPAYRNLGVGSTMFLKALRVMNNFLSIGDVGFLTARSSLHKKDKTTLFRYLLDIEKTANGENSNGEVIISGVQVENEDILAHTGVDYNSILIHPNAKAIGIFSEQAGLRFLGYSNKASLIYSKIW